MSFNINLINHNEIFNLVNDLFQKLTSSILPKEQFVDYYLPVVQYLDQLDNNLTIIGVCGGQGTGKSTFSEILKLILSEYFHKKILILSLDDFYLTKNERKILKKTIHPLLETRGVPGTHDIVLLKDTLEKIKNKQFPINIPMFDKLIDDRSKEENVIFEKPDIIILEGWCLGCTPIPSSILKKNINNLEELEDKHYIWRNYYNDKITGEYQSFFKTFDAIFYLKAPSIEKIFHWRKKQENLLVSKSQNDDILKMTDEKLKKFINHYEKITLWMLDNLPKRANICLELNEKHLFSNIFFKHNKND